MEELPGSKPAQKGDRGKEIFWGAWHQIIGLGLVELVGHLIEADTDTGDIIHPYAVDNGEPAERRIAEAAHNAGLAMLTDTSQRGAEEGWGKAAGFHIAPIMAHITEVQMVGIPRLRYRPQTRATTEWYSKMSEWEAWSERYVGMVASTRDQHPTVDMQHQRASR